MAGIVAVCVPTYRPLIKHWMDRVTKCRLCNSKPKSSPHGIGVSGSRAKDQLNLIEMTDKAASRLDSGSKGSHWVQVREYEERIVMGVK